MNGYERKGKESLGQPLVVSSVNKYVWDVSLSCIFFRWSPSNKQPGVLCGSCHHLECCPSLPDGAEFVWGRMNSQPPDLPAQWVEMGPVDHCNRTEVSIAHPQWTWRWLVVQVVDLISSDDEVEDAALDSTAPVSSGAVLAFDRWTIVAYLQESKQWNPS